MDTNVATNRKTRILKKI